MPLSALESSGLVSIGGEVYRVVPTNEIVPGVDPMLVTRWRWRADRRCAASNRARLKVLGDADSFRFKVVRMDDKWAVLALQNRLELVS